MKEAVDDLSEAVYRAGGVARDANISFEELTDLIKSIQKTTGVGGAVIGNGLKTMLSRIQRDATIGALEEYGITTKYTNGKTLPPLAILKNIATKYRYVSSKERYGISELVGGVFQLNLIESLIEEL